MGASIKYTKLFEVEIYHDYYLNLEDGNWSFPLNYSILNDLNFLPTPDTKKKLRDFRLIFKKSPKGFQLLARAIPSKVSVSLHQTLIPLPQDLHLNFFITLKNPFFLNYSNLRLTGSGKEVYFFNNDLRATTHPSGLFLSKEMLTYPALDDGETAYETGDIVDSGANTPNSILFEAKTNIFTPGGNLGSNDNRFIPIPHNTQYVSSLDRVKWQGTSYRYEQENLSPEETIIFELLDSDGQGVPLGNIPNTGEGQGLFISPKDSNDEVRHYINLRGIPSGRYTMNITPDSSPPSSESFFLLDSMVQQDLLGVIDIQTSMSNSDYQFIRYANQAGIRESIIEDKTYTVRFKNRTTIWKYFNQQMEELTYQENDEGAVTKHFRPRIGIRKQFYPDKFNSDTIYELNNPIDTGDLDLVPDAQVSAIFPVKDNSNPAYIKAIYSEIYLNQP